jgi:iron complex outermembrane recepter protein
VSLWQFIFGKPYPFCHPERSLTPTKPSHWTKAAYNLLIGGGVLMRIGVMAAAICLAIVGLSAAADSNAAIRKDTNIPAEGLGPALEALARTYEFQVLYRTEVVGELRTQGAAGTLTAPEALNQVLSGTGLSFKYLDDHTVTIIPMATSAATLPAASSDPDSGPTQAAATQQKEVKKNSSEQFRVAQVDRGTNSQPSAVAPAAVSQDSSKKGELDEVIVTAQKRDERLQDVPVPVTAVSADTLINSNQLRLQDFYSTIPGFNVTSIGAQSTQLLSIRGINTGIEGNPSVGITVDDVPYGSSTSAGGGVQVPDFDPGDLARVEVLRGPQGTLYGASSLGGLLKFVTLDPSMDRVSGRVQADISDVYNGADAGYGFRGNVNVPLTDSLAVRASGFAREDPGYIDNIVTGQRGINRTNAEGEHLSMLWKPSETLSLKFNALSQEIKADGSTDADVGGDSGTLQQDYIPGVGGYLRKFQAYSAILNAKLGAVDLTAISGYNINSFHDSFDYSYAIASIAKAQFGVTGTPLVTANKTNKFTQEVRLSMSPSPWLDLMLGGFYTNEKSQYSVSYLAENSSTGQIVGDGFYISFPTTYEEYAAFADLTIHASDRFDVQIGGRESQIKQTLSQTQIGPYVQTFDGVPSPDVNPEAEIKDNAFTYLLTPRLKISQDLMLYARLASGYRAGGVNVGAGVPPQYDPDKTEDYEIGAKGNVIDHILSFDASLYYIDWKNIQVTGITSTGFSYIANAAEAKSEGVELAVELRPVEDLKITAWVASGEAELTTGLPANSPLYGASGNRLPYSSRFSGNIGFDKDFALPRDMTGFVGGTVSYIGQRDGEFTSAPPTPPPRQEYPAYAKTDLRAGVKLDSWTVNLFFNNVTDRRGIIGGGLGSYPPLAFTYIQPRTIGLGVAKTF